MIRLRSSRTSDNHPKDSRRRGAKHYIAKHLVNQVLNSVGEELDIRGPLSERALSRLNNFLLRKDEMFRYMQVRIIVNLASISQKGHVFCHVNVGNILSRFSELKAILKSIFRITFSGFCSYSTRFRKTCAAISTPPLVPQPSMEINSSFEPIRRRVFPTAIDRVPPSFFPKNDKFSTKGRRSQTHRDL